MDDQTQTAAAFGAASDADDTLSASQTAASDVAPVAPPPTIDAALAGADAPPAGLPPESGPGAVALDPPFEDMLVVSDVIDTPAKALAAFGDESGVPPGTTDDIRPVESPPEPPVAPPEPAYASPTEAIDRLRAKLYAYGVECYDSVKPEVEYLQRSLLGS